MLARSHQASLPGLRVLHALAPSLECHFPWLLSSWWSFLGSLCGSYHSVTHLFTCLLSLADSAPWEQGLVFLSAWSSWRSACHLAPFRAASWVELHWNSLVEQRQGSECYGTPRQERQQEGLFFGKLCARLMEVWISVAWTQGNDSGSSWGCQRLKASQQPEKASKSCKLKWFPAFRTHTPHSIPASAFLPAS